MKWIVFLCLLLSACTPTKKVIESRATYESQVERVVDEIEESNVSVNEETITLNQIELLSDYLVIINEFDTDKPINPETGTPPLKSETIVTRNQQQNTREAISKKVSTLSGSLHQSRMYEHLHERVNIDSLVREEVARSRSEKRISLVPYIVLFIVVGLIYLFRNELFRLFQSLIKKLF